MKEVRLDLCERDEIFLEKFDGKLRRELIGYLTKTRIKYQKRMRDYQTAMKLYKEGLGRRRIAKILKCPSSVIGGWLYGNIKPSRKLQILKEYIKKLRNEAKLTNKEIGIILGVTPQAISKYINQRKESYAKFLSEDVVNFIKNSLNPIQFLDYFWIDNISKKEAQNFEKFCKFEKLKNKFSPFKLANLIGKSYVVVYNWQSQKSFPRLTRWLEVYIKLGKPKDGFVWLSLNLGSGGMPLGPFIQVPLKVTKWDEIENVINQLEEKENILPTMNKEECFGFVLGMIVGDTSKPKPNKDNLDLQLSKNISTNKKLGEFFCNCLQKLKFRTYRVKDSQNKYRWLTQSSPFFSWIYKVVLGLKEDETTTYFPIKINWILDAPLDFIKRFIQGIFESDGSVSYEGLISCSTYPDTEILQILLNKFGIVSYIILDKKWKKLIIEGKKQIEKCNNLLFAPEIKTKRYNLLERIVSAKINKKGQKLPQEIREKIINLIKKNLKTYKIVKRILLDNNFYVSRSAIEYYRNKIEGEVKK